jgi:hypothetical protein
MDEWDPVDDEIDWLTGKYTNKLQKLKTAIQKLEACNLDC